MSGNVPTYRDGKHFEDQDPIIYTVYNDLGSTVSQGDCYFLSYEKDADSLSPSARPTLLACATTAIPRQVVVALEDVADATYGRFMYRGYCPKVKAASTIAIDDYLQGTNASQTAADDGTTQTADSFGIAVTDEDTVAGFCEAILFGRESLIG